jgi:hypothetical protein
MRDRDRESARHGSPALALTAPNVPLTLHDGGDHRNRPQRRLRDEVQPANGDMIMTRPWTVSHSAGRTIARALGLLGVAACLACAPGSSAAQDANGLAGGRRHVPATIERGTIGPLNTTIGAARVIVPDGTSLTQAASVGGEDRWFVFGAEAGKTYTIEAVDADGDLDANQIGMLEVTDVDGTSNPPEAQFDCGLAGTAPSLASHASLDGERCVVRTFFPTSTTTLDKRAIFIRVVPFLTTPFRIRVRESTIYGRWTTNGYDFHVELQNTTTDPICAQLVFYPGTGTPGPTGTVFATHLNVPPKGAAKYVRPNGTLVNGDNKGVLRVNACGTFPFPDTNFVAGSLIANTYAYNPVTNQFITYATTQNVNGGAAANSW